MSLILSLLPQVSNTKLAEAVTKLNCYRYNRCDCVREIRKMADEKFANKKMDRREFLKKKRRAGLALNALW